MKKSKLENHHQLPHHGINSCSQLILCTELLKRREVAMTQKHRSISLIVIHCSATRVTQDFTFEQLEACHLARGFKEYRLSLLHHEGWCGISGSSGV